jgi:hypothetical protein
MRSTVPTTLKTQTIGSAILQPERNAMSAVSASRPAVRSPYAAGAAKADVPKRVRCGEPEQRFVTR